MISLPRLANVLAFPAAYRLWQKPFVRAKFAPIFRHNDLRSLRRVLDVGCGPGTNAALFLEVEYLGLDIDANYVKAARRRYQRDFVQADACTFQPADGRRFDFVLMNSLLHHIDTANVYRLLRGVRQQLEPDGHVHILDLVLPDEARISRLLAQADRGAYPRPLSCWREIFNDVFEEVVFEPYSVGCLGSTFWSMVYFKGRAKQ
jgi:SAM-dependent methyltransferase